MDEQLENRLRFLRKANTEGMPHTDRGLLDHLLGTRQLLVEWEARPALCDAGLFHSVYGTEYYELQAVPLTLRNEVQQLIGDEAESLAWLFCMMRRETLWENLGREGEAKVQHRVTDEWLPLTKIQFQDLFTLALANWRRFPDVPGWSVAICAGISGRIGPLLFHRPKGQSTALMFGGGRFGNEESAAESGAGADGGDMSRYWGS